MDKDLEICLDIAKTRIAMNQKRIEKAKKEKTKMTLKDTVAQMSSKRYKERFKAEFWQTVIREEEIHSLIDNWYTHPIQYKLPCPIDLLKMQRDMLINYLTILKIRAEIERINLKNPKLEKG